MAAALAEGETILENAAQEPEIPDLAEMLIQMGARSKATAPAHPHRRRGALHGCDHQVVADRIETGTFLCAVAAAGATWCCAMGAPTIWMPSSTSCARRAPR